MVLAGGFRLPAAFRAGNLRSRVAPLRMLAIVHRLFLPSGSFLGLFRPSSWVFLRLFSGFFSRTERM